MGWWDEDKSLFFPIFFLNSSMEKLEAISDFSFYFLIFYIYKTCSNFICKLGKKEEEKSTLVGKKNQFYF